MQEQVQLQKEEAESNASEKATVKPVVTQPVEKKTDKKEEKKEKPIAAKDKKPKQIKAEEKPKVEIVLERKYVVPLYAAYAKPAKKRGQAAMKLLKLFVSKHMKVALENVRVEPKLSQFINARGITRPPKKLNVKLQKDKSGLVTARPA